MTLRIDHPRLSSTDEIPWAALHQSSDITMLTGSRPKGVLETHGLLPGELHNRAVMDVGVGLGVMSRYLRTLPAARVICVDIVPEAFAHVAGGCECVLVADLPLAEPADCALCHLVMQHCTDELAERTLRGIVASLVPGGWLSVQMAGVVGQAPADLGEHVWRDKDACVDLCGRAGIGIDHLHEDDRYLPIRWYLMQGTAQ